jgi:hypothetical protein
VTPEVPGEREPGGCTDGDEHEPSSAAMHSGFDAIAQSNKAEGEPPEPAPPADEQTVRAEDHADGEGPD